MPLPKTILKVHTGTMFAGKTEALLAELKRYRIAKKTTLLFKPSLDNRYSNDSVVTHNGLSEKAIEITKIEEIYNHIDESVDVIGIDEIQFFDIESTIKVIEDLLFNEITVIAAGLDMDYKGRPFGPVPFLMAMADDVIKHHAVCIECGEDSIFEYRKDTDDSNLVKLGGINEYDSLCRSCRKKRLIKNGIL